MLALPYRGVVENLALLYIKMSYKNLGIRAFGGFHVTDRYTTISSEIQVEALLNRCFDGFKIMFSPNLAKYYGRFINDPYYDKGTPINIYLADPEDLKKRKDLNDNPMDEYYIRGGELI